MQALNSFPSLDRQEKNIWPYTSFYHISQVSLWDLTSQLGNKSLHVQVKAENISERHSPDGEE